MFKKAKKGALVWPILGASITATARDPEATAGCSLKLCTGMRLTVK